MIAIPAARRRLTAAVLLALILMAATEIEPFARSVTR